MTNQQNLGFADAVVARALAHFASINGWLLEGRSLVRAGTRGPAKTALPLESLTSFIAPAQSELSGVHLLAATQFAFHSAVSSNTVGQLERSFDELQKALAADGAVVLSWRRSKLELDAFHRPHLLAWLTLTGLRVAHESWDDASSGYLWLTGKPESIHSPERAELCIAALIRRYGDLEAEVSLANMQFHPRKEIPRDPVLSKWNRADVRVELKATAPRPKELTVIDFVSALRRAAAEAPRGFVGIAHFRERYFPTPGGKAQFDMLLSAAVQGELVRVSKVPDATRGTTVTALALVDRSPLATEADEHDFDEPG